MPTLRELIIACSETDIQRTFANLEEDVETEDAWEIASRRVSVISRRNSNHSIRLPHQNDTPSSQPVSAPGEPSTGVGFGDMTASIDELLAASSGQPSDDDHSIPRPDLARQHTVVGDTSRDRSDGGAATPTSDIGEAVTHATTAPVPIGSELLRPDAGGEAFSTTAASLAQTPLNDVFLSTLVISGPGRCDTGVNGATPATVSSAVASGANSQIAEEPEAEAQAEASNSVAVDEDHLLDDVVIA